MINKNKCGVVYTLCQWCNVLAKINYYFQLFIHYSLCVASSKIQGCGDVIKMTQLQLQSSSFHEHGSGSSSGALGFMSVAPVPELSLFNGSSSGFCSFSHTNNLNCLGVPHVEWKLN